MTTEITLIETIRNSLNGDNITALSTLLGLSGVSLRDLSGIGKIKNIFKKAAKDYPDGFEDEKVEGIFNDTIIELSEFLKNDHIDSQVFEKISNILFSGIKAKDLLTKEYIKIISNLDWIDLQVLVSIPFINYDTNNFITNNSSNKVICTYKQNDEETNKKNIMDLLKNNLSIPKELTHKSLEKLQDITLIDIDNLRTVEGFNNSKYIYMTTELGESIVELLENN